MKTIKEIQEQARKDLDLGIMEDDLLSDYINLAYMRGEIDKAEEYIKKIKRI